MKLTAAQRKALAHLHKWRLNGESNLIKQGVEGSALRDLEAAGLAKAPKPHHPYWYLTNEGYYLRQDLSEVDPEFRRMAAPLDKHIEETDGRE